ncbi:hypothetical protein ON010_g3557 [Phytophthora cinnamomi]|nr:hypothetical protein ON010_g3557 [Phytophthora cinnamomi]
MVSNKQLPQYFFALEAPGLFSADIAAKFASKHSWNYNEYERGGFKSLDTFGFVTDYACTVYHRIRWVVERKIVIEDEEVDNKFTRDMSRWASVSSQTLKTSAARILFDGVVKRYPETPNYLVKDPTIVHSLTFETTVVKVICGEYALARAEAVAIAPCCIGESITDEAEPDSSATFAVALLHAGGERSHAAAVV